MLVVVSREHVDSEMSSAGGNALSGAVLTGFEGPCRRHLLARRAACLKQFVELVVCFPRNLYHLAFLPLLSALFDAPDTLEL